MDFFELNINVFRMINDLGKQYAFLNPSAIFIAEYMVFFISFSSHRNYGSLEMNRVE